MSEGPDRDERRKPNGEQPPEEIGSLSRDLQRQERPCQEQTEHGQGSDQTPLLGDDRIDEVVLRLG